MKALGVPDMDIQIKRIYEPPSEDDGQRVLVDRLWPRGMSKEKAQLDQWAKELAPSTELRKWSGHDPDKWEEFRERYISELQDKSDEVQAFLDGLEGDKVTLLYGARDEEHNQAVVLAEYLRSVSG